MPIVYEAQRVTDRLTSHVRAEEIGIVRTTLKSSKTFAEAEKKRSAGKGCCTYGLVHLLYEMRRTDLKGVRHELTPKMCEAIKLPKVDGLYRHPSHRHLCDFKNHVLWTYR